MRNLYEECKGCYTNKSPYPNDLCLIQRYDSQDKCPCVNCVVKVMCFTECKKFTKLIEEFKDDTM